MAVAGMGTPSRNWPRGILIGLPGSYSDSMNLDTEIRGVNALTISLQKPSERGPEQGQITEVPAWRRPGAWVHRIGLMDP